MQKKFVALAGALMLGACATPPEKIAGVPNAGPCTQRDREQLAFLSNKQSKAATGDALGVFLIGVPMASLSGNDNEAEIAILKGRCERAAPRAPSSVRGAT